MGLRPPLKGGEGVWGGNKGGAPQSMYTGACIMYNVPHKGKPVQESRLRSSLISLVVYIQAQDVVR